MLSDNIRKYRKENNLSQDELADKLNISRQSVSLWENGQTQPTVDNIIALSEIFHITADELLKGEKAEAAVQITEPAPVNAPTKKKRVLLPVIIIALILIAGAAVLYLIFGREDEKRRAPDETAGRITEILKEFVSPSEAVKYAVALNKRNFMWDVLTPEVDKWVLKVRDKA